MEGLCRSTGGYSTKWRTSDLFPSRSYGASECVFCFFKFRLLFGKSECSVCVWCFFLWEILLLDYGDWIFFYICGFDILLILVFVVRGINKSGTKSANSTLQSSTKDPLSCSSHSTPGIMILLHQLLFPHLFIFSYVWLLFAEKVRESCWESPGKLGVMDWVVYLFKFG